MTNILTDYITKENDAFMDGVRAHKKAELNRVKELLAILEDKLLQCSYRREQEYLDPESDLPELCGEEKAIEETIKGIKRIWPELEVKDYGQKSSQ